MTSIVREFLAKRQRLLERLHDYRQLSASQAKSRRLTLQADETEQPIGLRELAKMVSHGCRPGQFGIVIDQSRGNGALAFHQALEPQQKIIRAVGKFGALAGMAVIRPAILAVTQFGAAPTILRRSIWLEAGRFCRDRTF
ncbi:hypothetical protein ACVSQB_42640, partial [Bradyrhizobium elkanii]